MLIHLITLLTFLEILKKWLYSDGIISLDTEDELLKDYYGDKQHFKNVADYLCQSNNFNLIIEYQKESLHYIYQYSLRKKADIYHSSILTMKKL